MNQIRDFPNYFICEDGVVFSNKRGKLKQLKPIRHSVGYLRVSLCYSDKKTEKYIHRLVAESFIPNPNNLSYVNHIDENKQNNHVTNLEWISHPDNVIHSCCRWIWTIKNIKTGELMTTINVREFANLNNLTYQALYQTFTGKRNTHKNFKIISKVKFK